MRVYFARHGQTVANARRILQGHRDIPLSSHGRLQAMLLAERLKGIQFQEVLSSSLSRAKETARICSIPHPGLRLQIEPGLKNRSLGSLEGASWPDPRNKAVPGDGESDQAVQNRIITWFKTFLDLHHPYIDDPDYIILVIAHGAYLKTLLSILVHHESSQWVFKASRTVDTELHCDNASLMIMDVMKGVERYEGIIHCWSDSKHLERLEGNALGAGAVEVGDDLKIGRACRLIK